MVETVVVESQARLAVLPLHTVVVVVVLALYPQAVQVQVAQAVVARVQPHRVMVLLVQSIQVVVVEVEAVQLLLRLVQVVLELLLFVIQTHFRILHPLVAV